MSFDNESSDPYGGFNNYEHAYDFENVYLDKEFVNAVSRSSYGRRPVTSYRPIGSSVAPTTLGLYGERGFSASGMRSATALGAPRSSAESARPMTAICAAGYTSASRTNAFYGPKPPSVGLGEAPGSAKEDSLKDKIGKLEASVNELLHESIFAYDDKDYKKALEKAKEAGRKERSAQKFRTMHSLGEPNLDLTLTVLLNLAQQYMANNMYNQSLHVYHAIVKNKTFLNAGRLKVNIGNIYFCKKDFSKAVKYYRMALDQIPKVQQRIRTKVLNNIGVALIKLGKYEDALAAFEDCLDSNGDYDSALNFLLAAYCLDDAEKMREAFQRLVDIPIMIDDDVKDVSDQDIINEQHIKNDPLTAWERRRKQIAERTIIIGARIISQSIAPTYAEGYAWCVDIIKQSVYASLAIELEINKAVELLKHGDIDKAIEALNTFNNRESKVASAAANNLVILNILKEPDKLTKIMQLSEQALEYDRYNASALVNRGNAYYLNNEPKLAQQCYKEALQVEASCVQAVYNLGLIAKENNEVDEAKRLFYQLNDMLLNNVEVLIQLASIYEMEDDIAQAIELYTQANNLAPTDPDILAHLAALYDSQGDKSQAFQYYYDSYRYFPANIEVIKWLGNYYLYAQFAEKAINYFKKASLMEPNNIEWQLLIGSCHRRSGNFQKAIEHYKEVHRQFPNNVECLKFLVQLCKDLRMMTEEKEYSEKLKRMEHVNQLKLQRESDSAQTHRSAAPFQHQHNAMLLGTVGSPGNNRHVSSRHSFRSALDPTFNSMTVAGQSSSLNNISSNQNGDRNQEQRQQDEADEIPDEINYKKFIGFNRPLTGVNRNVGDIFEDDNIYDLLPE